MARGTRGFPPPPSTGRLPCQVMRPVLAVALAWGLASSPALEAQESPASVETRPYSQLRFRLSGARALSTDALRDFWRSGTGGSLLVTTPFYVGSVGVGAALVPFRSREAGRPDFRALLIGVEWGSDVSLPGPFSARAAWRIGDFVMLIDNPDLWLDSESELFVGGEVSAGYALRRDLALTLAGSLAHVFTRPSLDLALVTVGLEYSTRTPGWLRSILE